MMEEGSTYETFINFNETAPGNKPEDGHLHTPSRWQNLKSHELQTSLQIPKAEEDRGEKYVQ